MKLSGDEKGAVGEQIESIKIETGPAVSDPWGFAQRSTEWHAQTNKKLLRKVDLRMIPLLCLMFLFSYLDRSNLAQARLGGLEADLGLQGVQFNTATSIFFVGYLLLQLPSNLFLTMVRPSLYLPAVMIVWGTICGCQAALKSYSGLVVARFFLGIAEAPYFPGSIFLMSTWYTRAELAKRLAFFYTGPALANMFGGLIAAGVLNGLKGVGGLEAWRWLFIIECIMTVSVAFAALFILPNFPATTTWLSEEERAYAVWRIESDIGSERAGYVEPTVWKSFKLAVSDYRTWILVVMQHCVLLSQTVTFFFPSVVNTLGYNNITTLLLTAPIWVATFVFNMIILWSTSRTKERTFHLIGSLAVTVTGNIMLITCHSRAPRFVGMFFMAMGAQPAFTIVLLWIASTFPSPIRKRAAVIALVNMIGNTSNIYGSYLYPSSAAPQYTFGGATIAGVAGLCCILALVLRYDLKRQNALIARHTDDLDETAGNEPHQEFVGVEYQRDLARKGFRYLY